MPASHVLERCCPLCVLQSGVPKRGGNTHLWETGPTAWCKIRKPCIVKDIDLHGPRIHLHGRSVHPHGIRCCLCGRRRIPSWEEIRSSWKRTAEILGKVRMHPNMIPMEITIPSGYRKLRPARCHYGALYDLSFYCAPFWICQDSGCPKPDAPAVHDKRSQSSA